MISDSELKRLHGSDLVKNFLSPKRSPEILSAIPRKVSFLLKQFLVVQQDHLQNTIHLTNGYLAERTINLQSTFSENGL